MSKDHTDATNSSWNFAVAGDVKGWDLTGSDLRHADFRGAEVEGAIVKEADMRHCYIFQEQLDSMVGDWKTKLSEGGGEDDVPWGTTCSCGLELPNKDPWARKEPK